jgi:hypothetical protein
MKIKKEYFMVWHINQTLYLTSEHFCKSIAIYKIDLLSFRFNRLFYLFISYKKSIMEKGFI